MKLRLLLLAVGIMAAVFAAVRWRPATIQPDPLRPAPSTEVAHAQVSPPPAANFATAAPTTPLLASAAVPITEAPAAAMPTPEAVAALAELPVALPTPFFEPAGCLAPPDDYTRVRVNSWWLSRRTLAMLQHAAELSGTTIDIAGSAITQGSYSDAGWGKYTTGAHLGGGAVDLSITPERALRPLYHELEPLLNALRVAGFAAWLRERSELYMGPDLHIHVVAIGDVEQSPEAAEELTGAFGYFRGYTGMPGPDGAAVPDPRGGPVVCKWMRDAGYADLREQAAAQAARPANWQEKLKQAASAYLANSVGETYEVAYRLDWLPGKTEDPSTMCGPLVAAILRDSGLLPPGIAPLTNASAFWLAKPRENGRPWKYFPARDYDLAQFDTPINQFDFAAWPLLPADIVYTYQWVSGYEHIFIVTEVDAEGRAYTVTNYPLPTGSFMVQRVLLYDPNDPTVGSLKTDWVKRGNKNGRTGMAGFDVLRQKGATLPAGSRFTYVVRPGDTLLAIAPIFNATLESIVAENQLADPYALAVGQQLVVTVGAPPAFSGEAPAPEPTEPTLPYDVAALGEVVLIGAQAARIRLEPNGLILDAAVRDGALVQILYGREVAGGITWLQVRLENGITGWMADFLLHITDLNPAR
jgi:hypothetical protein